MTDSSLVTAGGEGGLELKGRRCNQIVTGSIPATASNMLIDTLDPRYCKSFSLMLGKK